MIKNYREVLEPLTGITEDPNWDSPFVVPLGRGYTTLPALRRGLVAPPSYILSLLFCGIGGFRSARGDNSSWEIRLIFKGQRYRLWDYRRRTWSIGPIGSDIRDKRDVDDLVRKIKGAATRLDDKLGSVLQQEVDKSNFYLVNSYRQIRGGFEFFRDRVLLSAADLETWRNTPMPSFGNDPNRDVTALETGGTVIHSPLVDAHLNKQLRLLEAISYDSAAMVGFFFSFIELLVDAVFAFKADRQIRYLEFREKSWDERFKMVLPVGTDKELNSLHEKLRGVRKRIRDQVFHGLGGRHGLLVPFGPLGLIPVSFEDLKEHPHYSWQPISEQEARTVLGICEAFDNWTDNNDAVWYVRRFLEFGFELPFRPERVQEVRGWMTSRDEFENALQKEAQYLDHAMDQY